MKRAGYEVQPSACILVQTIEPQSRGLDHGHIVLGHATKMEKAFARFFVNALDRFASIGAFSTGGLDENLDAVFPALDQKASAHLRLLWIACGTEDRLIDGRAALPVDLAFFYDAGVAWNGGERPFEGRVVGFPGLHGR